MVILPSFSGFCEFQQLTPFLATWANITTPVWRSRPCIVHWDFSPRTPIFWNLIFNFIVTIFGKYVEPFRHEIPWEKLRKFTIFFKNYGMSLKICVKLLQMLGWDGEFYPWHDQYTFKITSNSLTIKSLPWYILVDAASFCRTCVLTLYSDRLNEKKNSWVSW